MKKTLTICVVCLLGTFLIIPPSFGQGKYSYRFEKWLELIDYFYFQPNNLDREQIEKEKPHVISMIMGHAFMQQSKFATSRKNLLFKEFEGDLWKYSEEVIIKSNYKTYDPNIGWMGVGPESYVMEIEYSSWGNEKRLMDWIKSDLGKDLRTEGDRMPSFTKWAQDGYPALEVPVRAIPMPPEVIKKVTDILSGEQPDKKGIELLGVEAESTEDLHFNGGFQKKTSEEDKEDIKMPDPSSAPDFDEFIEQ